MQSDEITLNLHYDRFPIKAWVRVTASVPIHELAITAHLYAGTVDKEKITVWCTGPLGLTVIFDRPQPGAHAELFVNTSHTVPVQVATSCDTFQMDSNTQETISLISI